MKQLIVDFKLLKKGFAEIHKIRPRLLTVQIVRAVLEALMPLITIYMSALIIDGIGKASWEQLLLYAAITVTLNLVIGLAVSLLKRSEAIMNADFAKLYELRISQKIATMDYVSVEDPLTHQKKQKIDELRNMNGGGIWKLLQAGELFRNLFAAVFALVMTAPLFATVGNNASGALQSFVCSPVFSVLIGIAILVNVFICVRANSLSTKKMYRIMDGIIPFNRVYGYYLDKYITSYHSGKDIRIYQQNDLIKSETEALFDDCNQTIKKLSKNEVKYSSITTVSTVMLSGLVYIFVGLKAFAGLFGIGSVTKYIGSINEFINGLSGFMMQLAQLRANNEAMQAYFDFMEIPSKSSETTDKRDATLSSYEIEFRDVSFQYPGSREYALRHINIKIENGMRLAVVGMNGSGKTTCIKLICRLYTPTEGKILLNGVDIQQYEYHSYLSALSVVFQDFNLFAFPIGENVAAHMEYDVEFVTKTLQDAGFGERLSQLDGGLNRCLYKDFDENGIEVSGGEAQKLALARALYKNAPIVILDEPTAALDPISESDIYSRFNKLVQGKTAIFISHRLSSCKFCDRIAVFDKGQIVQLGTHDELVSDTNGVYHELWSAQAQYYVDQNIS